MADTFNLDRFVRAQADVYPEVIAELRSGRKQGHWIWFIFPQMKGLGHSSLSIFYGVGSVEEASAYLQHPLLGPRLMECTTLVNQVENRTICEIMGTPDDMKFRSSMTLFAHLSEDASVFSAALEKYFDGQPDRLTLEMVQSRTRGVTRWRKLRRQLYRGALTEASRASRQTVAAWPA